MAKDVKGKKSIVVLATGMIRFQSTPRPNYEGTAAERRYDFMCRVWPSRHDYLNRVAIGQSKLTFLQAENQMKTFAK